MKILMLVNWKVAYENQIPEGKQPPDYVVPGQKYWFFRYLSDDISVDVVDIRSFPWLEQFEKEKIRFYIWQTLKVLPKLNQYDLVFVPWNAEWDCIVPVAQTVRTWKI